MRYSQQNTQRHSDQREIIYQVVCDSYDHPTAEMILKRAKTIKPSINTATVYRNLSFLVENKKVLRISLPTGDRFDRTIEPHSHFCCQECGRVFDIDGIDINEATKAIEKNQFVKIEKTDIMFIGLCENCKN